MNQSKTNHILCILALKRYTSYIEVHFPIEIIKHIILLNYVRIRISCGANYTWLIHKSVYICGDTHNGQLITNYNTPQKFVLNNDMLVNSANLQISCGEYHNVALEKSPNKSDKLYVWGFNKTDIYYILYPNPYSHLQLITLDEPISKVVCGGSHSIILTDFGEIYGLGQNNLGQLGLGHRSYTEAQLIKIQFPHKISQVACGEAYTIVLTENNEIFSSGRNLSGQLGLGHWNDTNSFIKIDSRFDKAKIIAIECGSYFSMFLTDVGTVYACGHNTRGQLGIGHNINQNLIQKLGLGDVVSLSCGAMYTFALTKQNHVYAWGYNAYGQLGFGNTIDQTLPQKLSFRETIRSVICGRYHIMVITDRDEIYACGYNKFGQLGLGHNIDQHVLCKLQF